MKKIYAVLDLETTGLNANSHDILQVSAIKFSEDFTLMETFNEYIKVGYVSDFILNFIHVNRCFLDENAKYKDQVLNHLKLFLSDVCVLVGHNIKSFDIKFLNNNGVNTDCFEIVDTLHYSRLINKSLPSHKLDYLVSYYEIENKFGLTHNSINDCFYEMEICYNLNQILPIPDFLEYTNSITKNKIKKISNNVWKSSDNKILDNIDFSTCDFLNCKNICFSGKFTKFDKKQIIQNFEMLNSNLHMNVTKKTHILIYVSKNSLKVKKAKKYNIETYSEMQFLDILNKYLKKKMQ